MAFKDDLLRKGFFPEGLPAPFNTEAVADYFIDNPSSYLSNKTSRSSDYSASKRGQSRRVFSAIHPTTAHDLAEFLRLNSATLDFRFATNLSSLSIPKQTPDGERALEISSHSHLEAERFSRLASYRYIVKTDVSRFYHSIYTHSIPWAVHGKEAAKKDRSPSSRDLPFNRLDFILRQGQDGQTIGIPVGPDASRYIAETIANAVDDHFLNAISGTDAAFVRHVDDVWIGTHTQADAERVLWCYRTSLREFELDINETKTEIYSANFRFTDSWPSEVSGRIELALGAAEHRREERLREALEHAFQLSLSQNDDGILKYAIRQIDRSGHDWDEWNVLQPFLARSAIHFGHTLDYVVRVLIWRKLTREDVDDTKWLKALTALLDRHGAVGNDSEVCWLLYAMLVFKQQVPERIGLSILKNCGALSIVALLNCSTEKRKALFQQTFERISLENGDGSMWPLFLEWGSTGWPLADNVRALCANDLISSMNNESIYIFDQKRLPRVFAGVEESRFSNIPNAIEDRTSFYDEEA